MGDIVIYKVCTGTGKRRDVHRNYQGTGLRHAITTGGHDVWTVVASDIRRPGQELLAMQVLITGTSTVSLISSSLLPRWCSIAGSKLMGAAHIDLMLFDRALAAPRPVATVVASTAKTTGSSTPAASTNQDSSGSPSNSLSASSPTAPSSTGGLSTGVAAGIGAGVEAAALLLAFGG
ncbi:hypothetical protein DHEL01_v206451 [Diaporthe helianthi]|uniref:Uncharacterized protein n=1 Tax=Diaporthe helianthi TaxID=158607 RepID=A0A2P5HY49_DIAHE|nr:hypothetical protein DHEL01_v206451 [Diaporthe helianthi]